MLLPLIGKWRPPYLLIEDMMGCKTVTCNNTVQTMFIKTNRNQTIKRDTSCAGFKGKRTCHLWLQDNTFTFLLHISSQVFSKLHNFDRRGGEQQHRAQVRLLWSCHTRKRKPNEQPINNPSAPRIEDSVEYSCWRNEYSQSDKQTAAQMTLISRHRNHNQATSMGKDKRHTGDGELTCSAATFCQFEFCLMEF